MATRVYRVDKPEEYRKAGPTDLLELQPAPGCNPLFLMKWIVETLVYAIVHHEIIHLSGPTGSAKTSLLEALYLVPANFDGICAGLGFPTLPLKLYPVEMATYEAPGELYQRRALKGGSTFDEKSRLVEALEDAAKAQGKSYPLIWLRELGRVHSTSVQGGLLNLVTKSDIVLPDGTRVDGKMIAWVADSNYQAEQDSTHTLVTLDDALRRRFSMNLTLDYLTAEDEIQVLRHLHAESTPEQRSSFFSQFRKGDAKGGKGEAGAPEKDDQIVKVVRLGNLIRKHRADGNLHSVPPPTIYGYLSFLRMAKALPHLNMQQVALATMLGNASLADRQHISGVLNESFGIKLAQDDDPTLGGNLF